MQPPPTDYIIVLGVGMLSANRAGVLDPRFMEKMANPDNYAGHGMIIAEENLMIPELKLNQTPGSRVEQIQPGVWRLEIPPGVKGSYRLAQLDDYQALPRRSFRWQPPLRLELRCHTSAPELPGTWGFGLWNDPFSLSLGLGGGTQRFPALPNAAWFFFASPQNYLSFRNNMPAQGFLAAVFRSPIFPAPLLALASPVLVLLALPWAARLGRWLMRQVIRQDAALIHTDVTTWHSYALEWQTNRLSWQVDGEKVMESKVAPQGRLSLVLWIDNQFAALPPRGRLRYGLLANPEAAWIELADIHLEKVDSENIA